MSDFKAVRVARSHTMTVAGTPERVFPLLCPTKEYDWIAIWDCDLVYSDSGVAEAGCVFATDFPQDGGRDIWVVSRYEPNRAIAFVRVNPLRTISYDITLSDAGNGTATAVWSQILTGLNEEGNRHVAAYSDEAYAGLMERCRAMLDHYLTTGTMLSGEGLRKLLAGHPNG